MWIPILQELWMDFKRCCSQLWTLPWKQELFWWCNTQQQVISGEVHKLHMEHCVYTQQLAVPLSVCLIAGSPSTGSCCPEATLEVAI